MFKKDQVGSPIIHLNVGPMRQFEFDEILTRMTMIAEMTVSTFTELSLSTLTVERQLRQR